MSAAAIPKQVYAAPPARERSVGELFGELGSEMGTLVRQEVKLASAEVSGKAAFVLKQSVRVLIGILLAQVSLLTLLASLSVGLAEYMPLWMSALFVGVAMAVVATVVTTSSVVALRHKDLAPKQTIESIADNRQWAREQVR